MAPREASEEEVPIIPSCNFVVREGWQFHVSIDKCCDTMNKHQQYKTLPKRHHHPPEEADGEASHNNRHERTRRRGMAELPMNRMDRMEFL